jgi:hypothetical protein
MRPRRPLIQGLGKRRKARRGRDRRQSQWLLLFKDRRKANRRGPERRGRAVQ